MLRHGVQYADITVKNCPMYEDVCASKVAEHLAQFYAPGFDARALIEKKCGRYTRGKHAGKLRGWAEIRVVTEGGWVRRGPDEGNGHVVYLGTVMGVRIIDFHGESYLEVGIQREDVT